MLGITLKINPNSKTVLIATGKHKEGAKLAMRKAFKDIGDVLVKETRQGIGNPPKTGQFYRYKGRTVQASAGGSRSNGWSVSADEYAANRSGKLKGSINSKTAGDWMYFGSAVNYGKWLEAGTPKMTKRSNLLKSIVNTRAEQINIVEKMFKREIK